MSEGIEMKKKMIGCLGALLAAALCLSAFVGCTPGDGATTTAADGGVTTPDNEYTGKLDGYTVVYQGYGAASMKDAAIKFAKKLGLESKADKARNDTYPDEGGLEILIGETDREQSKTALEALEKSPSASREFFYSISVEDNARVVVVGNKADAVARALDRLYNEYIVTTEEGIALNIANGESIFGGYDYKLITASNGTTFDTELISTVYDPRTTTSKGTQYPKVIELQHSTDNNGMMLASMECGGSTFMVYRSTDGGETWKFYSRATESMDETLKTHWMPHLYELPCQVGDMPKGTVLLSGTTVNNELGKSHITVWRSFDSGKRWEQYTEVAVGGGTCDTRPADNTYHGVWEPCILYDNGYLYCFYSDDSDPLHDQKLSYKRSSDGVNWEDQVDVLSFEEFHWRPGMISVTKMGNGKYFAPYEKVEYWGGSTDIYFKIVDSLDGDWKSTDEGTKLASVTKGGSEKGIGSSPWCAWTPAGGECGTLFVTANWGGEEYIYVSFDYGKTFEGVENPLYTPQTTGYSPSFFFSADGTTLFYANTVAKNATSPACTIQLAKIKIREKTDK